MHDFRRLLAGASLVAMLVAGGCTSILGDFNTGPGAADAGPETSLPEAAPPRDGGPEVMTMNDAAPEAAADAADAAEAAPPPPAKLTCDLWSSGGAHFVIDSLATGTGANRNYGGSINVDYVSANLARIVARPTYTTNAFSVFSFNPVQVMGSVVRTDFTQYDYVLDFHRTTGAEGVLVANTRTSGALGLDLYVIPDSFTGAGAAPIATTIAQSGITTGNSLGAEFLEVATNDYFYAADYETSPSPASYALSMGRTSMSTANPLVITTSQVSQDIGGSYGLLASGQNVYAYINNGTSGATSLTLPVTAVPPSPAPTPRALSGATPALLLRALASTASPGMYNLAMGEFNAQSATAVWTWRVGQVSAAQLDTFTAPDLPAVSSYSDIVDVAVQGTGGWNGDDFVWAGVALHGSTSVQGANFYWYDAFGHVRGEQVGTNSILSDRPNVTSVASTFAGAPAPLIASFAIAWTESATDSSGNSYETLYFDVLNCH